MIRAAVAYTSSDLYSRLAGVSIYSLYENNKKIDFHTYIISTGIEKENMDKLDMVADQFGRKINYINGNEVVKEICTWGGVLKYYDSYGIYVRPLSPELIQGDYDVIIFLDCDTLINGSIDKLIMRTAQLPSDKAVIMARNSENDMVRIKYGMKAESVTVNPGVMCINCNNWKASECTARFVDFFQKNDLSKYSTLDEIAYAKVLENKICVAGFNEIYYPCYRELSAKQLLFMYDLNEEHYYSQEEIEGAKGNEIILHYVNLLGHPWEKGGERTPMGDLWRKYYEQTPWYKECEEWDEPVKKNVGRKVVLCSYRLSKWLYVIINRLYWQFTISRTKKNDGIE